MKTGLFWNNNSIWNNNNKNLKQATVTAAQLLASNTLLDTLKAQFHDM